MSMWTWELQIPNCIYTFTFYLLKAHTENRWSRGIQNCSAFLFSNNIKTNIEITFVLISSLNASPAHVPLSSTAMFDTTVCSQCRISWSLMWWLSRKHISQQQMKIECAPADKCEMSCVIMWRKGNLFISRCRSVIDLKARGRPMETS